MHHPPVASPLLLVAVLFFGLGLYRLIRIFKDKITPFHFVFGLFALECLGQYYPVVQTSAGENVRPMSLDTEIFVVLASISLYMGVFLVRRGGEFKVNRYQVKFLIPLWLLAPAMAAVVAAVFVVNTMRLGTLPILALSVGDDYKGATETVMPFFSPLGWGVGRSLMVLTAFRVVTNEQRWRTFLLKNSVLLISTGLAFVCNTLDGLRNNAILPVLILFLGASRRYHIPLKRVLLPLAFCGVFFCGVGTLRVGKNDWKSMVTVSTGNRVIDTISSWYFTYTEPQLQNLDALIVSDPPLSYGMIIVSEILPGPLKDLIFDMPEHSSEYMERKGLIVHSGLTYRTLYADLYNDFGYAGSLLVGALLFAYSARIYTRAGRNPRVFLIYLIILPGIVFFPLVNWYVGLTNLLPFGLLILFRTSRVRPPPDTPLPDYEEETPWKEKPAVALAYGRRGWTGPA